MISRNFSISGEVQDDSKIQDSIVTDSLLQMTSFSNETEETEKEAPTEDIIAADSLQVMFHIVEIAEIYSHTFSTKKFVKAIYLLKNSLKSSFHEIFLG